MSSSHAKGSRGPREKKAKRCFCARCGGSNGPGALIPEPTFYRHQRKLKEQQRRDQAQNPAMAAIWGMAGGTSSASQDDQPGFRLDEDLDDDLMGPNSRSDSDQYQVSGMQGRDDEDEGDTGFEFDTNHSNTQDEVGTQADKNQDDDRPETPDPGSLVDLERGEVAAHPNRPTGAADPDPHANPDPSQRIEDDPELEEPLNYVPRIDDIRIAREFIKELREASLDSELSKSQLPEDVRRQLREPPTELLTLDNPTHRLSIDLFLALSSSSEATYSSVRSAIQRRFPREEILSHYKAKRLIENLTGIVPTKDDMCVNSCVAFTGPYKDLEQCPKCQEARFEPQHSQSRNRIPRKQSFTILIGPQLQAAWRSSEGAESMKYRTRYTQKVMQELIANDGERPDTMPYRDFVDGFDYLEAHMDKKIKDGDMVLLLSLDGAQLYRNKASDCWMYIWVILDRSPETRYKKRHILPGGFIPGPKKPKDLDSFIFPGLYHLSAVQRSGMRVWDASENIVLDSNPFLALDTADGPGMACMNGFVGHQGKVHCRIYCAIRGRHKEGASQYYPARLKPSNYNVEGCDHPDVVLEDLLEDQSKDKLRRYRTNLEWVERSPNPTEFRRRRLETGICKPSIFLGLPFNHVLAVPNCFPLDVMHLPALNIPDLFLSLWRATIDCDPTDNRATWDWAVLKQPAAWKAHGKEVVGATPYLPGSFDTPPRNPAEKLTSGYKAWEFLIYFYGFGPCLFFKLLPDKYWRNFCKLVRALRILLQEEIYPPQLREAEELLTSFSDEFEEIYYQRRADRLHFVRPSIHTPSHLPRETQRVGPGIIYSQWFMERTIGNLGEEIRQHSDPFSNLAQRGLRRCQVNALKAMVPDLEPTDTGIPRGAWDLGDLYILLPPLDNVRRPITEFEQDAFAIYITNTPHLPYPAAPITSITRWGRLRLPNGQIARTIWKENKSLRSLRCSRNIKFKSRAGSIHFAEIHYFAIIMRQDVRDAVAVVSLYSDPDADLLQMSFNTYLSVKHRRNDGITVISVKSILSVVAMVPDNHYQLYKRDDMGTHLDRWYVVEKPGLALVDKLDLAEAEEDD